MTARKKVEQSRREWFQFNKFAWQGINFGPDATKLDKERIRELIQMARRKGFLSGNQDSHAAVLIIQLWIKDFQDQEKTAHAS